MRHIIRKVIEEALKETYQELTPGEFVVSVPEVVGHGDYATNVALVSAKQAGQNPRQLAEKLIPSLQATSHQLQARIAGPGFINFTLADSFLLEQLEGILKNPEQWGMSDVGKGKTVTIDYFGPNIAKRLHIGHLRSAVIGDAIKRLILSQGYRAVSDTHVGDWGTQFGILLLGYKELVSKGDEQKILDDPFGELEKLYREENRRIEENPERREEAKQEFAKLEQGDFENRKVWQWMLEISLQKLFESADRLGLLPFEEHRGESFYEDKMQPIVEFAVEKGIAKKLDDGAIVVDLSDQGLDDAVMIKSDGASTYLLRDLATIQYRQKQWNFFKNLYVVDVRQSHHFQQVFMVAERLGFEGVGASTHIPFGFMSLPEGGFSSRKGNVIYLEKLIDEAIAKAKAVIAEKNPDLANADEVARMVGIGAIKYFDLSHNRTSDIVFRWADVLSFEGNTGPYLQYTYARLKSILRRAEKEKILPSPPFQKEGTTLDQVEHRLAAAILRLPEAIEDALVDYTPNTLANYLFGLAQLTNEFYHARPVMQEPDEQKKNLRLALVEATALTLKKGLYLLGIDAPKEM